MNRGNCINCYAGLVKRRIPICADCRRMGGIGMLIGGIIIGAVAKLFA